MSNAAVCHKAVALIINFDSERGFEYVKICKKSKLQGT